VSAWSLYFIVKAVLHHEGTLDMHWLPNLAFAIALLWPLASPRWQRARRWLAWPVAIVLLYQDTFLGSPDRLWAQVEGLAGFSAAYLWELARRVVPVMLLIKAAALIAAYLILSRWLRFSTLAFVAILSVPVTQAMQLAQREGVMNASAAPGSATGTVRLQAGTAPAGSSDPGLVLTSFYADQTKRKLTFAKPTQPPPFDVIVIHVCSMAWDDLAFVGQADPAVLKRFDLVFKQFNSAASYSGPASIRVLHGNCGQQSHKGLYSGIPAECATFPSLEKVGFTIQGLLNHNGEYDGFRREVETTGGLAGKMQSNAGAPVAMQAFDGSDVHDDGRLLSQWWKQRQSLGNTPVALYYNTISLHDGNRVPGFTSRSSLDTYKPRVIKLLSDLDKFVTELEASGRPVVLMLVPEHGASLRGDKLQISGMREIPGPNITLVPAAVKLIGLPKPAGAAAAPTTTVINQPMSYFGLYSLLGDMLIDNPFAPDSRPMSKRLDGLITTDFVSENSDVKVIRMPNGRYMMKSGETDWTPYPM
jgi:cellulose synthase operon protein YhjU